jgi:riboflavin synthase
MFTGLIEGVGTVKAIRRVRDDVKIVIRPRFSMEDCRAGDSVSVDGVCLTVTEITEGALIMDVSRETLSRSTLGDLRQGNAVNLERALRLSDRLGGHLVSGHVDGIGSILKMESRQRSWLIRVGIDAGLSRYIIEKGSVAVDGISLTVNRCGEGFFEVNIVPFTAKETTLLRKGVGDRVNIETDLIGKYVEKFFSRDRGVDNGKAGPRIDAEMLLKHGFGE